MVLFTEPDRLDAAESTSRLSRAQGPSKGCPNFPPLSIVAGPEELTARVIVVRFHVPNATRAFHLKEWMHAGRVTRERVGRTLIYRPPTRG
ncbi:hypothetical protein [Burkholderia gladioli]|uniref:hypothetical protein n=1 Tax=Burkholderia gladioli TaxID=28095 RepID=UPI00164166D2|nr:hypothetical protein [Burkholderia gladioli]MDN7921116.1 hypothetical protein [Burkholderia gladioli]